MDSHRVPSAGSHYGFDDTTDANMDLGMSQSTYCSDTHLQSVQHQSTTYGQSPTEYGNQYFGQWPTMSLAHQQLAHQQHLSAHSFSSGSSSFRSSGNSVFSHDPTRDSSISASSYTSDFPRDHYISQTEYLLTHSSSAQPSYAPSPVEGPTSSAPRKRSAQRQVAQEKDYFKTCISGNKQCRPCNKEQKYFCTACKRPFVEKADWKRHEETYQERPEMFQCDLCTAIYFLDKDFVAHHVHSHRCAACNENTKCSGKRHVQLAKNPRMTRTGWGCGFCCHFSSSWTERCNHIAHHLENEGKTMAEWHHSCVIYSLLHRPTIYSGWINLLESKRRRFTGFGWNRHSTGRVEGFPESNQTVQLQDALEYYTPDQDPAALAQLAYDKAVKRAAPPQEPVAPPVPPKDSSDYRDHHTTSLQELMKETDSWTQFINSVLDDDVLPTGVYHIEGRHAA
ncbi:uncharacterized protein K460DRAFT_349847 [Cucurbitaria berberidis CBS 394.84]|uniref:C2H2-type domain-containing protein n=1 Tax=Cucurbitaria berberidis CBS 394.84 TaxID=1168544 RepID=A0A9P4GQY0_9PLEO|nr:uncharacterized protein K460DRAFT_349847 [Cucurbitaria berberidis CBS 394.84]KAF1849684.1 hypothetical protein K460DRAFT_349847 [Cucurbitaria berberidis CBS 394.84]